MRPRRWEAWWSGERRVFGRGFRAYRSPCSPPWWARCARRRNGASVRIDGGDCPRDAQAAPGAPCAGLGDGRPHPSRDRVPGRQGRPRRWWHRPVPPPRAAGGAVCSTSSRWSVQMYLSGSKSAVGLSTCGLRDVAEVEGRRRHSAPIVIGDCVWCWMPVLRVGSSAGCRVWVGSVEGVQHCFFHVVGGVAATPCCYDTASRPRPSPRRSPPCCWGTSRAATS